MNKLSWYNAYVISLAMENEAMTKEASLSGNLSGLALALSLFFGGMNSAEAAQKANVDKDKVERAISKIQKTPTYNPTKTPDQNTVNKPSPSKITMQKSPEKNQKIESKESTIKMDSIIPKILVHEGLLPRQTPFRITSPSMGKWSRIYGFEIDRSTPKPKGREKFIFLKNADDVSKAVMKLFENYKNNPSKYKLSKSPTLKEAIQKFDQTGAASKIEYLKEKLPELDINLGLDKFF